MSDSPGVCCRTCAAPLVRIGSDICTTNVGFGGPPGHSHDDNCCTRDAWCAAGHHTTIAIRRSCNDKHAGWDVPDEAPACEWRGKLDCSCHNGAKLDAWPDLPVGGPP